jgi:hypothetical protein
MQDTPLKISQSLTSEQKRAVLEAVLHSQTFSRADQLKCLLKYVCEMEMAGRGQELTEYLIGIEALGRPANYSPGDDSAVRTRAFALRKKLQEFYGHERPNAALRIELLKGSYCPHFVESQLQQEVNIDGTAAEPLAPQLPAPPAVQEELRPTETPGRREWRRSWLLPFSAGVMLTTLLGGGLYWWLGVRRTAGAVPRNPAPILAEAWGPLLVPNAEALLCVANPTSFSVHPSALSPSTTTTPFTFPGALPMPQQLYGLYSKRTPVPANPALTITRNGTYWGDVLGALTAYKILHGAGVSPQIVPEMAITTPMLRGRNAILFGAPDYSSAIARFQENCPLRVNYLDAIVSADTGQPPVRYALKFGQQQRLTQVFGLITVLPGESSANQKTQILIFSGVNSAGAQAAAEFFSSPEHLLELKGELKKAGNDSFPSAYQVVVRADTDDSILLSFRYETFRIIPPTTSH